MFCPTCEAEYEPGITHCADDGAELVDRLNPAAGAHDDSEARFVPLHTLSSPAEAEMVNDILRQNDVIVQSGASDHPATVFSDVARRRNVDERDLDRARVSSTRLRRRHRRLPVRRRKTRKNQKKNQNRSRNCWFGLSAPNAVCLERG
jgi:hypothetical protein